MIEIDNLTKFRATHPCKHVEVTGIQWKYIASGNGAETLLILPGGLRIAEHAFGYIELFDKTYRVIAPTYPPLDSIDAMTDGLAAI